MMRHKQIIVNIPNYETELISLFISHTKGELSSSCTQKIDNLISSCKECQELYEEVSSFFDPGENLIFELNNRDIIKETRKMIGSLSAVHEHQNSIYPKEGEKEKNDQVFDLNELEDHFCCG